MEKEKELTDEQRAARFKKRLIYAALFFIACGYAAYTWRDKIVLFIAKPMVEFVNDPRNADLLQSADEAKPTAEEEGYAELSRRVFALPDKLRKALYRFGRGDENDRNSPAYEEMTEGTWRPLVEQLDAVVGRDAKPDPLRYTKRASLLNSILLKGGPPCEEPHFTYALHVLLGLARVSAERKLKCHPAVVTLKVLRAAQDIMRADALGAYRSGAALWLDGLATARDYIWREEKAKSLQSFEKLLAQTEMQSVGMDFMIERSEKFTLRAVQSFGGRFSMRMRILNSYYGNTEEFVKKAFREWKACAFDVYPKAYKSYAQTNLWFRDEPLASTYFARLLFPDMNDETVFFHNRVALSRITELCCRLREAYLVQQRFPEELEFMPGMLSVNLPSDPVADNIFGFQMDGDAKGFRVYTTGLNGIDEKLKSGTDDRVYYAYRLPDAAPVKVQEEDE